MFCFLRFFLDKVECGSGWIKRRVCGGNRRLRVGRDQERIVDSLEVGVLNLQVDVCVCLYLLFLCLYSERFGL